MLPEWCCREMSPPIHPSSIQSGPPHPANSPVLISFLFYSTHGVTLGFGKGEQCEQAGTGESYAEGRQKGENQEAETLGNTPGRGRRLKRALLED